MSRRICKYIPFSNLFIEALFRSVCRVGCGADRRLCCCRHRYFICRVFNFSSFSGLSLQFSVLILICASTSLYRQHYGHFELIEKNNKIKFEFNQKTFYKGLGYLMSSPAACPLTPASQSSTSPTFTSAKLAFRYRVSNFPCIIAEGLFENL